MCREINTFIFNNAKVPPLSSKSSAVNSFNCLQPAKLSSNSNFSHFTRKSFAESVLKSNNSLVSLGTFSTQSSCFIPNAYKFSVASVPVKNVLSFSSNSDNTFASRAYVVICKFLAQNLTQSVRIIQSLIFYQFW